MMHPISFTPSLNQVFIPSIVACPGCNRQTMPRMHGTMLGSTSGGGRGAVTSPVIATQGSAVPGPTVSGQNNVVLGVPGAQRVSTVLDPTVAGQGNSILGVTGAQRDGTILDPTVAGQDNVVLGATGDRQASAALDSTVGRQRVVALGSASIGRSDMVVGPTVGMGSDALNGQGSAVLGPSNVGRSGAILQDIGGRNDANVVQGIYTAMTERNAFRNNNIVQNINSGMNMESFANANVGAGGQTVVQGLPRNRALPAYEPIVYDRQSGMNLPNNNIIHNAINNNNNIDNNISSFMGRTRNSHFIENRNIQNFNNNLNSNNQMNMHFNSINTNNRAAANSVHENNNNNIDNRFNVAGIKFIGQTSGGQRTPGTFDNRNLNRGITNRNSGQTYQPLPPSVGGSNNKRNLNFEAVDGPVDRIIYADQQVSADRQLRAGNTFLTGNNNLGISTDRTADINNRFGPAYDIALSAAQPAPQGSVGGSVVGVDQGVGIDTGRRRQQKIGYSSFSNNNELLNNAQNFNNQNAFNSLQRLGPKDIFRQPLTGRTLDFRFMGSQLPVSGGASQTVGSGPSMESWMNSDLASTENVGVNIFSNASRKTNQNTDFGNTAPPADVIATAPGQANAVLPTGGVAVTSTGANTKANSAVDLNLRAPAVVLGTSAVTDLPGGAKSAVEVNAGPLTDQNAGSVLSPGVASAADPKTNSVNSQNTVDLNTVNMNQVGGTAAQNQSGTINLIDLPPGNKIGPNTGIQIFEVTSDIAGILAGSTVHDLGPVDIFSVGKMGAQAKPGRGSNVQIVVLDGAKAGGLLSGSASAPVDTSANNNSPTESAPMRIGAQSINISGIGRLGKPVGSIPANSGEVLGVFSLPSGFNLPPVDPSVSAIPKSIERAAAAGPAEPSGSSGAP